MGSSSFSSSTPFFASFLETSTHLYKRLCPSVGPSVVPWVGPSVRGSVRNPLTKNAILARKLKESSTIQENSRKFFHSHIYWTHLCSYRTCLDLFSTEILR